MKRLSVLPVTLVLLAALLPSCSPRIYGRLELVDNPSPKTLHQIHRMKKDLILLRKSVWPLREVVNTLVKEESSLIQDRTRFFLRDVYDHAVHVIETTETFREMVSEMTDEVASTLPIPGKAEVI